MVGVSLTVLFGIVFGITLAFSSHTSLDSWPREAVTQTQMQDRNQDSVLFILNPQCVWNLQLWPQWGLCTQLSIPST